MSKTEIKISMVSGKKRLKKQPFNLVFSFFFKTISILVSQTSLLAERTSDLPYERCIT